MEKNKLYTLSDLSEREYNLIMRIRDKYRYCRLEIVTHNGQPERIERTLERDNLDTKLC